VFENWAYKVFFFVTEINGVIPDQTIFGFSTEGLISRDYYVSKVLMPS